MQLIGRDAALGLVRSRLAEARLVTLTGPGGIGKTSLARAVARRLRDERAEVWFVDAVTLDEPANLPSAIASALELAVGPAGEAAAIDEYFGSLEAYLVLDNLENLVAAGVGRVVAERIEASPGLRVLATSRIPLGAPDEVQVPVAGLELPAADDPSTVAASASGALFLERARALGSTQELRPDEAVDLAAVLRRLDGMPLAIELAAGRSRVLTVAELRRRLDDPATLAGPSVGDPRHRSLRTVLAWSIALLDAEQREALDAAAAWPGSFDVDVLAAQVPAIDVVPALDALLAAGLVHVDGETDGSRWFTLLEPVRAAVRQAVDAERQEALEARIAAVVDAEVAIIGDALWGSDQASPYRRAARLRPSIEAALAWSVAHDPAMGLRILTALDRYWRQAGWDAAPLRWVERLVPAADPGDPSLAYAEVVRIELVLVRDGPDAACAVADAAIPLALAAGVPRVIRRAYTGAAQAHHASGDWAAVGTFLVQAADWTSDADDAAGLRIAGLAHRAIADGRMRDARDLLLESADAHRRHGDTWNTAQATFMLAMVEWRLGEAVAAVSSARAGATLMGEIGYDEEARPVRVLALANGGVPDEARAILVDSWRLVERAHPVARIELLEAAVPLARVEGRAADAVAIHAAATRARAATGWAADSLATWLVEQHLAAAERVLGPVKAGIARHEGESLDVRAAFGRAIAEPSGRYRAPEARIALDELTAREVEVLALIGSGRSDAEIAEVLTISPKTASVHVSNVKGKLGAGSRLEVALRAREMGLVGEAPRDRS